MVIMFKPFVFVLHVGGLSQDQRLEAMWKLKQYQCRVLISTDLVRMSNYYNTYTGKYRMFNTKVTFFFSYKSVSSTDVTWY